jgi:hypothetical protein
VNSDEPNRAAQFYLAHPGMDENDVSFGYPAVDVDHMLRERWGMDSVFATKAMLPVIEGRFWPRSINPRPLD